MNIFLRVTLLLSMLGSLLVLFSCSAIISESPPHAVLAHEITSAILTQTAAEPMNGIGALPEPPPEPEPEIIPPASYVSSLISITDSLPVINIRDTAGAPAQEYIDGRIVLPSLIGWKESDLTPLTPERFTLNFSYDWYPLPEGVIYAASFMGEMTDEAFYIMPDSTLTLHVSLGMNPAVTVLTEESKTVYLTFDDGPHWKNTEKILDTLDAYGIHATFFTVGSYAERYPDIIKDAYDRGNKIGCHSYTHQYQHIYAKPENMMEEIGQWEAAVEKALGFLPPERLFRYPGGSSTCKNKDVHEALLKDGWRIFDWSAANNDCLIHTRPEGVSDIDYMTQSVIDTMAYSFVLKKTPNIILMHDTYAQTAQLLPWMIEYLQSLGCSFATLDELPAGWFY